MYNSLDEILWKDWDPIGVHGIEEARDEYHGYLPTVFEMVLQRETPAKIAGYLHYVVNERMGLNSRLKDHVAVAEKIYALGKSHE